MIRTKYLVSSLIFSTSFLLAGCPGDGESLLIEKNTSAIAIVVDDSTSRNPIKNTRILVNDQTGKLITDGTTDYNGIFIIKDVPHGGSVSAALKNFSDIPTLETIYGIVPNGTYVFTGLTSTSSKAGRPQIKITMSEVPDATEYLASAGPCRGSNTKRRQTIVLLEECLESGNLASIYLVARGRNNMPLASTFVSDIKIEATGTTTVEIEKWNSKTKYVGVEFYNQTETGVSEISTEFRVKRNGILYEVPIVSAVENETFGTTLYEFQYPENLVSSQRSPASFLVSFKGRLDGRIIGFDNETHSSAKLLRYDLAKHLVDVEVGGILANFSKRDQPLISWDRGTSTSIKNSDVDTVASVLNWKSDRAGYASWIAIAPTEMGEVLLPELPDDLLEYKIGTAAQYIGPEIYFLRDPTKRDGNQRNYQHMVSTGGIEKRLILQKPAIQFEALEYAVIGSSASEDSAPTKKKATYHKKMKWMY